MVICFSLARAANFVHPTTGVIYSLDEFLVKQVFVIEMFRSNFLKLFTPFQRHLNLNELRMKDMPFIVQLRLMRFRPRRLANPGVENRLKILGFNDKDDITKEELDEMENSESDFMSVHLTHQEAEREMQNTQDFVRSKILEKKYFKKNRDPALLTWEEKEQIRNLHKMNPEKWNVHSLALSFPASETVIQKILKAKWKPASIDRVLEYNKSVEKNWRMIYEGKIQLSEETRAHLAKFASRKKVVHPPTDLYASEITESSVVTISSEFSDIVKTSKSVEMISDPLHKVKQSFTENSFRKVSEEDTYVLNDGEQQTSQTLVTLDFYRDQILRSGKPLDVIDKAIIENYKDSSGKQSDCKKLISPKDFSVAKQGSQSNELKQKIIIRNHIDIPPHLRKKGSLFKLDDCYYDEDGELLYRVPGMA